MPKHNNRKFVIDIIKNLEHNGFSCETKGKNRNKYYISKGKGTPTYMMHSGDSYYPIRGWLKQQYDFDFIITK